MPITVTKAYEIINLNIIDAGKRMPPDVKESLYLALDSLAFFMAARLAGTVDQSFRLKHEPPLGDDQDNHNKTTDAPSGDLAPT